MDSYRILQFIIGLRVFPAVVVHDFLCDAGQYNKADDYLEEILTSSKVSKWKRISIVGGVRFYTKWLRGIIV